MNPIFITSGSQKILQESTVYIDNSEEENIDIQVEENINSSYFYFHTGGKKIRTFSLGNGSSIDVRGIIIGTNIESELSFHIKGTDITSYMDILTFAIDDSNIQVKGVAKVSLGSKGINVRVDQTNILVGENTRVQGMPVLEVATDDVVGGHSCKIHRISGDTVFYLQSHGIDTKHAEIMLMQSEIWKRLQILQGTEVADIFCAEVFDRLRNSGLKK